MTTGPEHYETAEACIRRAAEAREDRNWPLAAAWCSEAQVHATLAQAAGFARLWQGVPVANTGAPWTAVEPHDP